MAWTYPVKQHGPGKLVHHKCGYPLWVKVMAHMGPVTPCEGYGFAHAQLSAHESILVEYRLIDEHGVPGLVVYQCPQCGGVLKLWWHVDPLTGEFVDE